MVKHVFKMGISTILLVSCGMQTIYKQVKNGDIIFVEARNENLSGAISRVTKSKEHTISYDHTALIEVVGKSRNILHASGENGSEKLPLKSFIKKNKKEKRIMEIYRLKSPHENCINNAISKANTMLGKPYNMLYILNENSYYCSDFVERAYRDCHIFQLTPMTFINPETGTTDDYWAQFYHSKQIKVPEGELGCNPNGISKSDKIIKVFRIK